MPAAALPVDAPDALLVARVWVDGSGSCTVLALVGADDGFDLSSVAATASQLLELPDAALAVRANSASLSRLGDMAEVLAKARKRRQQGGRGSQGGDRRDG